MNKLARMKKCNGKGSNVLLFALSKQLSNNCICLTFYESDIKSDGIRRRNRKKNKNETKLEPRLFALQSDMMIRLNGEE